jgi:hypothetical protein
VQHLEPGIGRESEAGAHVVQRLGQQLRPRERSSSEHRDAGVGQAELLGRQHRPEVDLVAHHQIGPGLDGEVEDDPGPGRRRATGEPAGQHPLLVRETGHQERADARRLVDVGAGPTAENRRPGRRPIEGRQANATCGPPRAPHERWGPTAVVA